MLGRCSSAAEQGSHKPRVGGSIPPTATTFTPSQEPFSNPASDPLQLAVTGAETGSGAARGGDPGRGAGTRSKCLPVDLLQLGLGRFAESSAGMPRIALAKRSTTTYFEYASEAYLFTGL
jgi:hypothetical protein